MEPLERPHAAHRASTSSTFEPSASDSVQSWVRSPSLFRLGICLLEVGYNRAIKNLAQVDEKDDTGEPWTYTPFLTAMRLSKTVQNELGLRYAQAVRSCLEAPNAEADDLDASRMVLEEIVQPLQDAADGFAL